MEQPYQEDLGTQKHTNQDGEHDQPEMINIC